MPNKSAEKVSEREGHAERKSLFPKGFSEKSSEALKCKFNLLKKNTPKLAHEYILTRPHGTRRLQKWQSIKELAMLRGKHMYNERLMNLLEFQSPAVLNIYIFSGRSVTCLQYYKSELNEL